jgi:hypothetical protein
MAMNFERERDMGIDFVYLGDTSVTAMVEQDPEKRASAIEGWLDSAVPILQGGLRDHIKEWIQLTVNKGVNQTKAKASIYQLRLDFGFERAGERGAAQASPSAGAMPLPASQNTSSDDGGGDWATGRSPNDDRSDSMNPNNSAYQAAMDNRSDQMNPNNPAYHSSRGR